MKQALYFMAGVAATLAISPFSPFEDPRLAATAFVTSPNTIQIDDNPRSTGTHRGDNGLFFIDGGVEKETVRFLVDTGASHVVLSHEAARKLGSYTLLADTQKLMTVGGPATVDWIVIKEIEFDGHVMKNLKAAIPRNDVGLSLLGQNALAQFAAVHIDGDHLTLIAQEPADSFIGTRLN